MEKVAKYRERIVILKEDRRAKKAMVRIIGCLFCVIACVFACEFIRAVYQCVFSEVDRMKVWIKDVG